jgi:hypothetical protein
VRTNNKDNNYFIASRTNAEELNLFPYTPSPNIFVLLLLALLLLAVGDCGGEEQKEAQRQYNYINKKEKKRVVHVS